MIGADMMPFLLTRRHALALLGGGAATILAARLSPVLAAQDDAAFVRELGAKLIGIINNASPLAEKRRQILPLIDQYVDVSGIGRFALGRYWRTATPEQQQEFLHLFHQVLITSITDKLGDYKGVQMKVGSSQSHGAGRQLVNTVITRPSQPPLNVQWIVGQVNGAPKIEDVIGEGVSLGITERGDYTSYLQRNDNNVEALINALKRQAAHRA